MYKCGDNCGHTDKRWFGLCPKCKEGTGVETADIPTEEIVVKGKKQKQKKINVDFGDTSIKNISSEEFIRIDTGLNQLNIVFGGMEDKFGIAKNSLALLSGEPGVGKSTLLLQLIDHIAGQGMNCGYISAEENESQIKQRYDRLNCKNNFDIKHETDLEIVELLIEKKELDFIIVDSINTIFLDGMGTLGGISQIKECTMRLMKLAKSKNKTIILIGQLNKDNELAGPKILEHMVDSFFHMEPFDEQNRYKILNSNKNRFGMVNENCIFEMTENGLQEVLDTSSIFMEESEEADIGHSISMIFKGNRAIFLEIESLVVETNAEKSIIQPTGIDSKRYFQYLAILQKYLNFSTYGKNVFSNIAGGVKLNFRENVQLDLPIIASILSSENEVSIKNYIFIGEVSLSGKIKKVPNEDLFVKQIKKLGIKKKIISHTEGYQNITDLLEIIN